MISVIIVNYNRKDLLRKCLDSVRGQTFQDIEIIVADNASNDGSVEMVATYYPEVRLIQNTANLLFCRAQNQGIDTSKGNFILCLNSDCVLDKDFLKEALFAIGLDTKIGMVSGKILRMDKKTIDSTGLFLGRNRKAVERGYGKLDRGQHEKAGYIFGVSGACAFFRRSMLKEIRDGHGYFDERFGMYYEDLDLSWRAQKKGWKAYYNPKAVTYHVRGGTAVDYGINPLPRPFGKCVSHNRSESLQQKGRGLGFHQKNSLQPKADPPMAEKAVFPYINMELKKKYIINRYRCMIKNDSILGILVNLPFILLYEIIIWCYFLLTKITRHSII